MTKSKLVSLKVADENNNEHGKNQKNEAHQQQAKDSTLFDLLKQIPHSSSVMDELNALLLLSSSNKNQQKKNENSNKTVSKLAETVSKLFEQLNKFNDIKSVFEHEDLKKLLSCIIQALNYEEKRLLYSAILTQLLNIFRNKITLEQLKELESNLKNNKSAQCMFIACLHESKFVPVTPENNKEWELRINQLLQIYNSKNAANLRNLICEILISIIKSGMEHDKDLTKKNIVDPHVAPLLAPAFSTFKLHHFTLAYQLSLLFPKSYSLKSNDQTESNIMISNKFIDELYAYLQFSDQLPPVVDGHIDELSKCSTDTIMSKINHFFDLGIFTKTGIKAGADYCYKLLNNSKIGISRFPLTNQTFIKSWPNPNKRAAKRDLVAINRLDKALKLKVAESDSCLNNLVDKLEQDQKNSALKNFVSKLISHSILPDMNAILSVLRHVLKNNKSDYTTKIVVSAIETNCRIYDSQKCDPEKILELLKLLFVPAFFVCENQPNESPYILRTCPISDDLRYTISDHLLEFMKNLSLLEQHNEIYHSSKAKVESTHPKVPTQMKAWSQELLQFENALTHDKHIKISTANTFSTEANAVRTNLQKVRNFIVSLLAENDYSAAQIAQLCSLKVLVGHILICQLEDPEVITEDMVDDLEHFIRYIFTPEKENNMKVKKGKGNANVEDDGSEPKPMEVFTDILIGVVIAEKSLTYAARMCLFAFSSYLNTECFHLLFQVLTYNDTPVETQIKAEDQDENDEESDNEELGNEEHNNDEADEAEDNGSDNMSDTEEGEDNTEEDAEWDDEKMFAIDESIAATFKIRKLEAEKRKKAKQPQIEIAKNVLTMLEGLVHKSTPNIVLIIMFVECLDYIRGSINNPRVVILDRVISIAKNIAKADGRAKPILDSIATAHHSDKNVTYLTQFSEEQLGEIEEKIMPQLAHILSFLSNKKLTGSKASQHTQMSIKSLMLDKSVPLLISILDRLCSVRNNKKLVSDSVKIIAKVLTKSGYRFKVQAAFVLGAPFLLPALTRHMTHKFKKSTKVHRSEVIRFYHYVINHCSKSKQPFFTELNELKNIFEFMASICSTFEAKMPTKGEFNQFITSLYKLSEMLVTLKVSFTLSEITQVRDMLQSLKAKNQQLLNHIDKVVNTLKGVNTVPDNNSDQPAASLVPEESKESEPKAQQQKTKRKRAEGKEVKNAEEDKEPPQKKKRKMPTSKKQISK